ncbi:DUF6506 family protein [Modicisalibacter coralii]|uniref:DUF6506 family protein n=1 Tax=Modicisalibacter coralii TaxID=2304602 RepID=UPI00100AFB64|nr:DUF6506 family protein [Halomonas coralii]
MARSHLAFLVLVPSSGNTSLTSQGGKGYTLSLGTVDSIDAAARLARELAEQGVEAIELSASFGDAGVARIREAVGPSVKVGRVHYETP